METRKRIYIGLLAGSLFFALAGAAILWYLLANRDIIISQILLICLVTLAGLVFLILGIGICAIVIMVIRSKTIPSLETITRLANDILFPLTLVTGKLLGIKREKILGSYIEVNNYLVKSKELKLRGEQIMILVPHCLQNSECPFKITIDINNCKECGKCKIGELKKLAREYHAVLRVATGGTLARKYIKQFHPSAVVAVACERDLSLGIHDTGVLPVLGVLNCRPNGPCFNTDVNLSKVKDALNIMNKGG